MQQKTHHSLLVGETILSCRNLDQVLGLILSGYQAQHIGLDELAPFDYSPFVDIGLHLRELSISSRWQCRHSSL